MKLLFKRVINLFLKLIFTFLVGRLVHKFNEGKITIISMHGIMKYHDKVLWNPLREQLTPSALERTVCVLSKHYTFISLDCAYAILSGKEKPVKNGLVFTLDDGYWNNLSYAGPIFKKYNVIPTIFVATKNIDECSPFWFDRLDYALQQLEGRYYKIKLLGSDFSFDLASRVSLKKSYASFREIIKRNFFKDEEMRDLLNSLSFDIEVITGKSLSSIIPYDDWARIASWEELCDVSYQQEFNVGSHTVDHTRIALVSDDVVEYQLKESKAKIEQKLNVDCKFFCYPNGSYNLHVAQKVFDSGYSLAVTTEVGVNKVGDNLMTLRRFNIPNKYKVNDILHALSPFRL
ncbi:MAG: polysaccharide deacetylase family protein [Psychromonas sp.]|nr:polysaccharide deacetylase family protein [Alteromonadales bacterium]MCP5078220.1 polysaccharide deacetylase family protein [Psychromonas sp.]